FKEYKNLFLRKKGHFGTKKRGFAAVLEHGFLSRKNKQTRYSTAFHAILVVYKKSKSRLFRDVSFSILGRFVFAIIASKHKFTTLNSIYNLLNFPATSHLKSKNKLKNKKL